MWNHHVLIPVLHAAGLEVLDPWNKPGAFPGQPHEEPRTSEDNHRLAAANEAMIRSAAGLLAILDGTDVDSGTAAELGFAAALGKRIVGLRTDFRVVADNHAANVNLQLEYWIVRGGGAIYADPEGAGRAMAALLA
jgi:nucleoside 2-deoxyribosyltransferase